MHTNLRLRTGDEPFALGAEPPAEPRTLRILHLSDTHLLGDPVGRYNGIVDTFASLSAVLRGHNEVADLDLVVVSGDLSEDGSPASYRRLRDLVEPWAAERGARCVYTVGNHDDRAAFRQVFGSWSAYDESAETRAIRNKRPIFSHTTVAGFRVLCIDTSVPGESWGRFGAESLARLKGELAKPSQNGTIVVMHHPPLPPETPLHRVIGLIDLDDVARVLQSADVRLVLAGHWHHQLVDTALGFPVVVTPGTGNRTDVLAPAGTERSVVSAAATLLTLDERGRMRLTATEIEVQAHGAELFALAGDELAGLAERIGHPVEA